MLILNLRLSSWNGCWFADCITNFIMTGNYFPCTALGKHFKFPSNLSIPNKTVRSLPSYYREL